MGFLSLIRSCRSGPDEGFRGGIIFGKYQQTNGNAKDSVDSGDGDGCASAFAKHSGDSFDQELQRGGRFYFKAPVR